jgi:hypothetical protein
VVLEENPSMRKICGIGGESFMGRKYVVFDENPSWGENM